MDLNSKHFILSFYHLFKNDRDPSKITQVIAWTDGHTQTDKQTIKNVPLHNIIVRGMNIFKYLALCYSQHTSNYLTSYYLAVCTLQVGYSEQLYLFSRIREIS